MIDPCSTPFGITDYIGIGWNTSTPPASRCAQRLSASRIISVAAGTTVKHLPAMCSTPFGITDYIGLRCRSALSAGRHVLNAFRHHGLYRLERRMATVAGF